MVTDAILHLFVAYMKKMKLAHYVFFSHNILIFKSD